MYRGGLYAVLSLFVLVTSLAAINTDIARWGAWDTDKSVSHSNQGSSATRPITNVKTRVADAAEVMVRNLVPAESTVVKVEPGAASGQSSNAKAPSTLGFAAPIIRSFARGSTASDVLGDNDDDTNFKATLWEICGRGFRDEQVETCYSATDSDITCADFRKRFTAMESLYCLTAVFSLLGVIFAVLDHGNVRKFKYYGFILIIISLCLVGFSVSGWALAIDTVKSDYCTDLDWQWHSMHSQPDFEWGASAFCLVGSSFFALIMLGLSLSTPKVSEGFHPVHG
jgi:hypothetical protein